MTLVRSGLLAVLLLLSLPAGAAELVVKRVMLSAGGVAYVEREAEVEGDAELGLDLPLDQVDDVLKSVVVYDSAGGVGSAHLPGREPVAQIFADLPFGAEALASPDALLNALQGGEIRIGGSHAITGKLMKVVPETVRLNDQSTLVRHRVSVMTASGLQQVILEESDSIAFTDPRLQAQVERALAAIAEHHAKDRRRIVLTARGTGKRVLRVGYVVAAPLWKSTYRLILGEAAEKAHLQGWAVLENMSGEDWDKIELTLFSGRPVSFRQALYQAYYVARPEVPVEVAGRILPRIDTGVVAATSGIEGRLKDDRDADKKETLDRLQRAASVPEPPSPAPEEKALLGAVDVAAAEEDMTQVAFRIPVPVSIKSGESAIVAIVDRDFPVRRRALYQPATVADHPLAAIELKNDSGNGLPAGVLTVYEKAPSGSAYLGDARLGALPAGEDRLLSYAVDDKTEIAREVTETAALAKVAAARGVLRLNHVSRQTIRYRIAAPKGEGRHLVIEEAKLPDWTLDDPQERATEQTAGGYRLPLELQPGESRTLALLLQRSDWEETAIGEIDADAIAAMAAADGALDAKAKRALEQLARLRQAVADAEGEQQRLKVQMQSINEDQSRIRENLRVLNSATELAKRYVATLDAQETALETLREQAATAARAERSAKVALDDFIAKLEL